MEPRKKVKVPDPVVDKEWARLIAKDGTPGAIVRVEFAIAYCKAHPDCTWEPSNKNC